MTSLVRSERHDGVGLIEIDNPPVNALSHPVRAALLAAVQSLDTDRGITALVIHGAGRHFIGGADIREFDTGPSAPLLNDVLLRLEACTKPVIAAIHGATLGGGAELALASHYRVGNRDLSIGFPEIKLGLLPGSGGTVRLPRLIGARAALDLMLSGEPISCDHALAAGLVDSEATGDLKTYALAFAREQAGRRAGVRRIREMPAPPPEEISACTDARERLAKDARRKAVGNRIVEAVEACLTRPFDAALAHARELFEAARVSVESRALRHLFFAERGAGAREKHAMQVARIGVVGAGTMGSGIALSALNSGFQVTLVDSNPDGLAGGRSRIEAGLQSAIRKGRTTEAAARATLGRLALGPSLEALHETDLVIEAVFESLPLKQRVFAELGGCTRSTTILATNTSTLDIDVIAAASGRAGRVVGMHFFSPAHVMRLVEIVNGRETDPESIAIAAAVARRLGKMAVEVGNAFGFVGNRMLYEYGREKELLLLEGASPQQIDRALEVFGMAMGPNAVGDLSGLDVGVSARSQWRDRPDDARYYRISELLVERGRLGQKCGQGFYRYDSDGQRLHDPEVDGLVREESARLGVARRAVSDAEVVERCILALINTGARLLDERIARSGADIDVIWCNGYGFPRARGGPMFHADTLGLPGVLSRIEELRRRYGAQFWPRSAVLERLAGSGGSLADYSVAR